MKSTLIALILTVSASFAQEVSILPYPGPIGPYEDLKKQLALTDTQMTALTNIARAKSEAQSALYRQMNEKSQALNNLLNSNSTEAARIGQFMIEINQLRRQTVPTEPYRSQALNLLTTEQKQKLPALVQALQLASAAYQATSLNLIDHPSVPSPRYLPAAGGEADLTVTANPIP